MADQKPTEATQEAQVTVPASRARDPLTGRLLPGHSGNPNGRPKRYRQELGEINQAMELAVRSKIPAHDVIKVIQQTLKDCFDADYRVANASRKLVFEYFMQKPKDEDVVEKEDSTIVVKIENATFKATHKPEEVTEGEFEVVQ